MKAYAFDAEHIPPPREKAGPELVEAKAGDDARALHAGVRSAVAPAKSHAAAIAACLDVILGELAAEGFDAVDALAFLSSSLAARMLDKMAGRPTDPPMSIILRTQLTLLGKTSGVVMRAVGVPEMTVRVGHESERRAP